MSRPRSNPVRYGTLLSAEAALLTLAIHGLLLFGFSYQKPKPVVSTRSAGVLSMLKIPSGSQGKAFCRWLEYHDPAVAVRSRSGSGYQSFLPRPKGVQITPPALRYCDPKMPAPEIPQATKVEVPPALVGGYLPQAPADPVKETAYPFVLFDSGRAMPISFAPGELLTLGKLPDSPSRIALGEVVEQGKMRRFSIRSSSGNRGADLLALRHVLALAAPQERECTVYWKSGKGGQQ